MPYKNKADKARHNKEYQVKRYAQDPAFREKKRKRTEDWRKNRVEHYNEYMRKYRKRKSQYEKFVMARIEWKARRNLRDCLEIMQSFSHKKASVSFTNTALN